MVVGAGTSSDPLTLEGIVAAAHRVHPNNPVMAQLAAAQAVLESGIGTGRVSGLARNHNNLFGIKGSGDNGSVVLPTREVRNGVSAMENAQFAAFSSPEGSLLRHAELMQRPRYASVGQAQTFEEAARAVQASGYATDPNYAAALIRIQRTIISSVSENYQINSPYFNPAASESHVLTALEQSSGGAHASEVTRLRELLQGNTDQRIQGLQGIGALNRRLLVQAGVASSESAIPMAVFHLSQKLGPEMAAAIHRAPDGQSVLELESNEGRRAERLAAIQTYVEESRGLLTSDALDRMGLAQADRARLDRILGRRAAAPASTPSATAAPAAGGSETAPATAAPQGQEQPASPAPQSQTPPPATGQAQSQAATPQAGGQAQDRPLEASELTAGDLRLLARARSGQNNQQVEQARAQNRSTRRRPDGSTMTEQEAEEEDRRLSSMSSGNMGELGIGGMLLMMILFLIAPSLAQNLMGGGQQSPATQQGTGADGQASSRPDQRAGITQDHQFADLVAYTPPEMRLPVASVPDSSVGPAFAPGSGNVRGLG